MNDSAIVASGLRKAYQDKTVLDGVGLEVRTGTIFSLFGPHGAGKTTTVNVLTTRWSWMTSWPMIVGSPHERGPIRSTLGRRRVRVLAPVRDIGEVLKGGMQ